MRQELHTVNGANHVLMYVYEWFYFVFLRVNEYFIIFACYTETDKCTNANYR